VLIVVGLMPVLMLAYLTNEAFGFFLNLICVMSFTGLHEVPCELESICAHCCRADASSHAGLPYERSIWLFLEPYLCYEFYRLA
jgi:hypothetical protein